MVKFFTKIAMLAALGSAMPLYGQSAFGVRSFSAAQPPSYGALDGAQAAQVARGYALFKAPWGAASDAHPGLGPLYNASSCNACHNEGRHGEGPRSEGAAPDALVIQLVASPGSATSGDPVYGAVLNTHAVSGVAPEGNVQIEYGQISGYYYPYGDWWSMRVPHYRIQGLTRGPLAPGTIISPRVAPSLYGLGLLEAVPDAQLQPNAAQGDGRGASVHHEFQGRSQLGRMGWQNDAVSIRDQTTKAFANEMGVTSSDRRHDDCTAQETDCQGAGNNPEVSDELLADLTAFLQTLAVPAAPTRAKEHAAGAETFQELGCAECHRPQLTAHLEKDEAIFPYTDLRLHDLGLEMADETVGGVKVATRWRTAPLWGLGYRLQKEKFPTFLHDGRARSVEEAILWHYGEASRARFRFMSLGPNARSALLQWLQTL